MQKLIIRLLDKSNSGEILEKKQKAGQICKKLTL